MNSLKVLCLLLGHCLMSYAAKEKIVGGLDAEEGAFPHQVSLRLNNRHFCGGSILNENWILTAAHCVDGQKANEVTVVTGTNTLDNGGDVYEAEKLIGHPTYIFLTITDDIALIKVKKPIQFNDKVKPIKLPTKNTEPGTNLILSGWGRTSYPGDIPNKLQTIELKSIGLLTCITEHPLHVITWNHLCTFTREGQGACHGDSGGPLIEGEEQVGVVSWGIPCGKGKPDVFTRVYRYLDWINNTMDVQNRI